MAEYLLSFSRTEPLSWLGHLDTMRLFERALRRADLPLLWSQGFNPRPDLVFALPGGVGLEAEADLMTLQLTDDLAPRELLERLASVFPPGLRVWQAENLLPGNESCMTAVEACRYRFEAKAVGREAEQVLSQATELIVDKRNKRKELKALDIRPLIHEWTCPSEDCLLLTCAAGSKLNLRSDLFLEALCRQSSFSCEEALACRIVREKLFLSKSFDARRQTGL